MSKKMTEEDEERRRELLEFGIKRDIARKEGREHRKVLAAANQQRAEDAIRLVAKLAGVDVAILSKNN